MENDARHMSYNSLFPECVRGLYDNLKANVEAGTETPRLDTVRTTDRSTNHAACPEILSFVSRLLYVTNCFPICQAAD